MMLSGKYETSEFISGDSVKTYGAHKLSSGETVWIHLLEAGRRAEHLALIDSLERLPAPATRLFLDAGEDGGTLYLVSSVLPGFTDLRQWIESTLNPAPPEAPPVESAPGEFTRYFQAAPASIEPAAVPEPPAEKPAGEFTRFFGSAPLSSEAPPAMAPQPEPAGPSEYTLLVRAQPAPPPETVPAPETPPPPPAAKRPYLPLAVGLAALLAALLLVLYFVLKR